MNIATILNESLKGRGSFEIKPFSQDRWNIIADLIVWEGSDKYGFAREVRFSDLNWRPINESKSIESFNVGREYEYELKVLLLSLYTNGTGEGMRPLKWATLIPLIRGLCFLAKELSSNNILSYSEFHTIEGLRLRNILLSIFQKNDFYSKFGFCDKLNKSIYWLECYGLLKERDAELFRELLLPILTVYKSKVKRKHPLIPVDVLMKLIKSVHNEIEHLKPFIEKWKAFQELDIQRIQSGKFSIVNGAYRSLFHQSKSSKGLMDKVSLIPGLVNVFVLAFTGMRDGEALSLKNNCLTIRKNEDGDLFLLTAELSKTTDGVQNLEWICGEQTANAVSLLASINKIVHKKANAILKYLGDSISDEYKNELKHGINENYLNAASYSTRSCYFYKVSKRPNSRAYNISEYFKIPVTKKDIQHLERYSCNYKSVARNSSIIHEPYLVGDYFNFTPHQFRHTFAWFLIANRLVDLDDVRYQYKHIYENMTLIYSKRGYESISELINISEGLAVELSKLIGEEIFESSVAETIGGKGGKEFGGRIREWLGSHYKGDIQPHFKDMKQLVEYMSVITNDIRELPHGYCTQNLAACNGKGIVNPTACVYCKGYIATPKSLKYWKTIKASCEKKIINIEALDTKSQLQLETIKMVSKNSLDAANNVIDSLEFNYEEESHE